MNCLKVFEKAVTKAEGNGYTNPGGFNGSWLFKQGRVTDVIFTPEFGKAFWGEFKVRYYNREHKDISKEEYDRLGDDLAGSELINKGWQYHQHKMLDYIQKGKEPLKYIEMFL